MGFLPSRSVTDSEYILTRSTTEAKLAANARTEQAAAAHHKIASCYLAKLFDVQSPASLDDLLGTRPTLPIKSAAIRSPDLRFADVKPIPENDELTRILNRLP